MFRVIAFTTVALLVASAAEAQPPLSDLAPSSTPSQPARTDADGASTQIKDVFNQMKGNVEYLDKLLAYLKALAEKKPSDIAAEVKSAAANMSILADRMTANGDVGKQLVGIRTAAALHEKRVQEMPQGAIAEEDRTRIVTAWQHIIQEADKATASMGDVHNRIMDVLTELRMKQAAVGELLLAGQYEAAMETFEKWLADLQTTVNSLHEIISQFGTPPSS